MKGRGLLAVGPRTIGIMMNRFAAAILLAALLLASPAAGAEDAAGSSDAARVAYASAAALQNREAWDLAAEEWAALIAAHPQDPLARKGRYSLGICQLKADQWSEAQKSFRELVAAGGDPATVALARWEIGYGEFRRAQSQPKPEAYAAAAKALAEFLEKSPGESRGSWDPLGPVPDRWGQYGGRLYVTTLHLLALEVPYRHLPTYSLESP